MSATYNYPSVYVEEVPSSVRSIIGVGTSITAFVGRALKGPLDKATLIHNFGDYTRIFGGLWKKSNMSYAVYQYFQNGGIDAIIVRVATSTASPTTFAVKSYPTRIVVDRIITALEGMITGEFKGADGEINQTAIKACVEPVVAVVKEAGLELVTALFEEVLPEDIAVKGVFKAVFKSLVNEAILGAVTVAVKAAESEFADPDGGGANEAKDRAEEEITKLFPVVDKAIAEKMNKVLSDVLDKAIAEEEIDAKNKKAVALAVNEAVAAAVAKVVKEAPDQWFTLIAADPGVWGDKLEVVISDADPDKKRQDDDKTYFDIAVCQKDASGKSGPLLEMFRNVSLNKASPRYICNLLVNGVSTYLRIADPDNVNTLPDIYSKTGRLMYNVAVDVICDGSDGSELSNAEVIGYEDPKKGIYALKDADLFNLLCIPAFTETKDNRKPVYDAALKLCNDRRAILLVDPPAAPTWNSSEGAKDGIDGRVDRDKNGAIFFPRIKAPDPLEEYRLREFDPCGAVAGVIARTDAQRGVWKAPAGIEAVLSGVPDLAVWLTNEENGDLNPKGINCLRIFPDVGRIIWGARTLRGADGLADQWKYLSVRRTALFIEETLYRGTQWVVFEPNDERLWSQIRLNVGSFMHSLFVKGAFQGSDPKQAYLVKCDSETTTQTDIDRGIVNVVVGFAPLKPAEFVVLKIQQLAGQESE